MGCACKRAGPDWPRSKYLPMSPEQSRSLSHFAPGLKRTALSSLFSHIVFIFSVPLPRPDSSLGILCYQVMLMAKKMWVDWQGRGGVGWVGGGIKAACPAVDQGRNPASGLLSQDYHGQRQRIHPEGWMIISGWGHCRHCGFYFWLCASNFIINVLQWTKRKGEQSGVVVRLDLRCGGISPVWTFVSITWSACQWHKWRSQSLFIITLTFKIKNRSQHVAVLNAWWCCCTTDLQGWQLQTNSAGFFGFVCFKANETHLLFLLPVCVLINTTSHPRGKEKVWVWL